MMGFFVYSISLPKNTKDIAFDFTSISENLLKIISSIFPRLDLFGKTEWLIYGIQKKSDIYIIIIQSIIYLLLMLYIAFYDFNKKEF